MKRIILLVFLGLALALSQLACSGESEEPATEATEMAQKDEMTDPANKTHPIRSSDNPIVTLETNHGKMVVELYRDVAPAHADSFLARTNDGFYDSTIFHRVIAGFMIQGGDPTGTGTGGPGYSIPAEFSELPHQEGTLSMARGPEPNSAGSQFFICLARRPNLDRQYTVFGQLIKGYDVLQKIGSVPVGPQEYGERSKPMEEVKLIDAYASDTEGNPLS
jgi:peptidyl-prolyl cis-trans isomerase B (cyclophilin B)